MDHSQNRLELDSRLTELSRVQPWIESLADRHGFDEDALFAMHLCVEEALANVVLHGYRSEPGHPIAIQASVSAGNLFFAIDDQAPPFSRSNQVRANGERNLPISNRLNQAETVSGCCGVLRGHSLTKDFQIATGLR